MLERAALPVRTRATLTVLAALSSLTFGWAAIELPWRPGTPLALLAGALSVLHAVTAVSACWRSAALLRVWRLLAFLSLAAVPIFAGAIGATAIELVARYGALGWGLTALLLAIGWLLLVGTVPLAVWGLRWVGDAHGRR